MTIETIIRVLYIIVGLTIGGAVAIIIASLAIADARADREGR